MVLQKQKEEMKEIIKYLVTEMYENPDNDGNSPLHLACLAKDLKLAQIILGMECDVNISHYQQQW